MISSAHVLRQRAGDRDHLLRGGPQRRARARRARCRVVEALEQRRSSRAASRRGRAAGPRRGSWPRKTLSATRQVLDEVELLVDRRHADGHRRARLADRQRLAVDEDLALGRRDHARDALDQRRLAGAVGTEQAVHLAGAHVEVDARRARARPGTPWRARAPRARRARAHSGDPRRLGGDVDPALLARGGEHGLGDPRGAQAVGEQRDAVRAALAADRGVDLGDEAVEAVGVALRMAGGQRWRARGGGRQVSGSRRSASRPRGARATASPGSSWLNASDLVGASSSSHRRFLRPAETWLMTVVPIAPGRSRTARWRRPRCRPCGPRRRRWRGGRRHALGLHALGHRRHRARAHAGDAMAGDELGEVAPVRPDVGERPRGAAEVLVDAPVVVLGRTSQSCR